MWGSAILVTAEAAKFEGDIPTATMMLVGYFFFGSDTAHLLGCRFRKRTSLLLYNAADIDDRSRHVSEDC